MTKLQNIMVAGGMAALSACGQSRTPGGKSESLRRASWGEPSYEIAYQDDRLWGSGNKAEAGFRGEGCTDFAVSSAGLMYYILHERKAIRSAISARPDEAVSASLYIRYDGREISGYRMLASTTAIPTPSDVSALLPSSWSRESRHDVTLPISAVPPSGCENVIRVDIFAGN